VGLNEQIQIVKTPLEVYTVRADGHSEPISVTNAAEREARLSRFGALDPDFAASLAGVDSSKAIDVAIYLTIDLSWDEVETQLHSADADARQAATAAIRDGGTSAQRAALPILTAAGLQEPQVHEGTVPVVFGSATPATIHTIARLPGVSMVTANLTAQPHYNAGTPTNAVTDPQINTTYNAMGYYADGQKIGFVEAADCGIYDAHEAFQFTGNGAGHATGIVYQVEPNTCSANTDCGVCNGSFPYNPLFSSFGRCVDLGRGHGTQCLDYHLNEVTSSTVAARGGTKFGASDATIYFPNQGVQGPNDPFPLIACSQAGMQNAFTWLQAEGVSTVNESFDCPIAVDGVTEDWYARYYDMSISTRLATMGRTATMWAPAQKASTWSASAGSIPPRRCRASPLGKILSTRTKAKREVIARSPTSWLSLAMPRTAA
jgi:hypothetical protein